MQTYISELPTDVDNCVAIIDFGGPHSHYFAKEQIDTPYVKIMCRNNDYVAGHNIIEACKSILTSYADAQTLGIVMTQDIYYLGRDDKRRNVWQMVYKIFSYIGG